MQKSKIIYNLLFITLLLGSCSGYEKVLKSDDPDLKYRRAFEFYNEGDFVKSATIFEQLLPLLRGTKRSDSVQFYLAKSYYGQRDFILAGYHFQNFATIYANSDMAEEAEFMVPYCHYKSSPRPSLDQTETVTAITKFQLFLIKFPNAERKEEVLSLIKELQEKLVEKSYLSAKLYFDMGEYKASIIALNNSLIDYPDTKYRQELMFMVLKSRYLLAENSVFTKQKERYQSALDEYYSFVTEFPEGKYAKEANKIYQETLEALDITEAETETVDITD
jgi:outer membrane protein assembly factor BamD